MPELLYVDDSERDSQQLQTSLEESGYGVVIAANGAEAQEAVLRERVAELETTR